MPKRISFSSFPRGNERLYSVWEAGVLRQAFPWKIVLCMRNQGLTSGFPFRFTIKFPFLLSFSAFSVSLLDIFLLVARAQPDKSICRFVSSTIGLSISVSNILDSSHLWADIVVSSLNHDSWVTLSCVHPCFTSFVSLIIIMVMYISFLYVKSYRCVYVMLNSNSVLIE